MKILLCCGWWLIIKILFLLTPGSSTQVKEAMSLPFVCLISLFCIFAQNLKGDGLAQPTGKYCSIRHMEYPEFQTGIFG